MSKADIDPAVDKVTFTTTAGVRDGVSVAKIPFKLPVPTGRSCIIKLTQASFDPLFNPWGVPVAMKEGDYVRLAIAPYGLPSIILNAAIVAGLAYLFPSVLITRMPWRPDADAGQPIDIECETAAPYSVPGETAVTFSA